MGVTTKQDFIDEQLKVLADSLPHFSYEYQDSVVMTGAELKLTPYDDQQELEDEKEYVVPVPGFGQVNHFRRLKRAYARNGLEGVSAYCDLIKKSVTQKQ